MFKISIKKLIAIIFIAIGLALSSINLYGLTQNIRPAVFFPDELRFKNDITLSLAQTDQQIKKQPNETEQEYAARITKVIAAGIAHVKWKSFDSEQFNQLIPIWENYFLYFMGKYSGIPEFERYHFADYQRSINRGIGICGDASMIMSQLLDKQGIKNQLLTFPGHVIVSASFDNGKELTYDPDFGVVLGKKPDELKKYHSNISQLYLESGYTKGDQTIMNRIYNNNYQRWNGVKHFITKKYYFEKISYFLKWPLPILLILLGLWLFKQKKLNG